MGVEIINGVKREVEDLGDMKRHKVYWKGNTDTITVYTNRKTDDLTREYDTQAVVIGGAFGDSERAERIEGVVLPILSYVKTMGSFFGVDIENQKKLTQYSGYFSKLFFGDLHEPSDEEKAPGRRKVGSFLRISLERSVNTDLKDFEVAVDDGYLETIKGPEGLIYFPTELSVKSIHDFIINAMKYGVELA